MLGLTWWLARMSEHFVWGSGHLQRPIRLVVVIYLGMWLVYAVACYLVERVHSRRVAWGIIGVGILLRVLMLGSTPLQESDFYRYIWDGQLVVRGINPLDRSPSDWDISEVEADLEQRPAAAAVQGRINHPEVASIYPAGAQSIFALNAMLFGWRNHGMRWTLLLFDLGLLVLLARLLWKRGQAPAILWYAWCPLILKEFTNSMHVDIACAFFLGWMLWAVWRDRPGWSLAALLAASLVKITPLLLVPLLVGWAWRSRGRRWTLWAVALWCACLAAGWAVLWLGADDPFAGLRTFSSQWENNALLFPLLRRLLGWIGLPGADARLATQAIVALALVIGVLQAAIRVRTAEGVTRAGEYALLALFLLSPVGNPWYLGWLLPFMVLRRSGPAMMVMVGTSVYYLNFWIHYHDLGADAIWWLWITQYLLILLALAIRAFSSKVAPIVPATGS